MAKFFLWLKNHLVGWYKKISKYIDINLMHEIGRLLPNLSYLKVLWLYIGSIIAFATFSALYLYSILNVVLFFKKAVDRMFAYANDFLSFRTLNDTIFGATPTAHYQVEYITLFFDILNTLGLFKAFFLVLDLFAELYFNIFYIYIMKMSIEIFYFICRGIYIYLKFVPNFQPPHKLLNKYTKKSDTPTLPTNIDKFLPKD